MCTTGVPNADHLPKTHAKIHFEPAFVNSYSQSWRFSVWIRDYRSDMDQSIYTQDEIVVEAKYSAERCIGRAT